MGVVKDVCGWCSMSFPVIILQSTANYMCIQEFLSTAAVSVICGIAVYMYFNLVRCSTDLQQTGLKCLDMCHHPSDVDKGK